MPARLTINEIHRHFSIYQISEPFVVDRELSQEVDEIWHLAREKNARLFDGGTLAVRDLSQTQMHCFVVPYRFFYAQTVNPTLRSALNLRSAAVSGVTILGGQHLVGRRAKDVSQCAELLELVPSGSLSASTIKPSCEIDFKNQLLCELKEEVNIDSNLIESVVPFLLTDDIANSVVDICCAIAVGGTTVETVLENFSNDEYSELRYYNLKELRELLAKNPDGWVPTSEAIISSFK